MHGAVELGTKKPLVGARLGRTGLPEGWLPALAPCFRRQEGACAGDGPEELTLEILVRASAPPPSVVTATRGPDPGIVEKLRRDFGSQGMLCHATRYGLLCRGRREALGRILGPCARTAGPGASLPVPDHLGGLIEQIRVAGMAALLP